MITPSTIPIPALAPPANPGAGRSALLPEVTRLTAGLTVALEGNSALPAPLTIVERKLPPRTSTFPNETVMCRFANGREERVFVKYEAGQSHESYGHRGGVNYEAKVYHHLLRHYPGFRPRCLGAHTDPQNGETWLVLEYIENCVPVIEIPVKDPAREPISMLESARWIARFHAAHEQSAAPRRSNVTGLLKCYDAEYYTGWCRRTAQLTRPLHNVHPWLPELCKKEAEWLAILLTAPQTIIHGEYYGKTLMFREGEVFPVDWESTALAVGEIDLAALTEGRHWPARGVEQCERVYEKTRWPNSPHPSRTGSSSAPRASSPFHPTFQQTLDAARIYLHFRWLGERPDWTLREKTLWRYDHLEAAAERLGLI